MRPMRAKTVTRHLVLGAGRNPFRVQLLSLARHKVPRDEVPPERALYPTCTYPVWSSPKR